METIELIKCNYCGTEYPIKDKKGNYITVFDKETKTTMSRCTCCYHLNEFDDNFCRLLNIEAERQLDIELPKYKELLKALNESNEHIGTIAEFNKAFEESLEKHTKNYEYEFPMEFGTNITLDNIYSGRITIPEESDNNKYKYTKQKNKFSRIIPILFLGGELLLISSIFINRSISIIVLPSVVCTTFLYLTIKRRILIRKINKKYSNKSVISGYIDLEEENKELFDISNLHDQCPYCMSKQHKELHRIGNKNNLVKCKICKTKYRTSRYRTNKYRANKRKYNKKIEDKIIETKNLYKEIWTNDEINSLFKEIWRNEE